MIRPGATLGVLGGGQLGLLFALSARRAGFRTVVLDPDPQAPAMACADWTIVARYDDTEALLRLSESCQAITTEFENVPAASLEFLAARGVVRPSALSVAICQDRIREKTFLADNGFLTAPFIVVAGSSRPSPETIAPLLPGILKTSREGYDGKGQWPIDTIDDLFSVTDTFPGPFILEKKLDLDRELSLVIARGSDGRTALYPVSENFHERGILHLSAVPADIPQEISGKIREIGEAIAQGLDYTGVMAVEYFLDRSGRLYVNEMAPRPHNSGHYTIDACVASQFDQQVRSLCDLPLASPRLLSPCSMGNLLGDLWPEEALPDFAPILSEPRAKLTLYGKKSPRPGRKMGHFTVLGESVRESASLSRSILTRLYQNVSALSSGKGFPVEKKPVPR